MDRLVNIFRALANEHRLAIFEHIRVEEARSAESPFPGLCVCHIAARFDLALSTVSHHLKELRNSGLIRCEKRGQWVYCAIDPAAMKQVAAFIGTDRKRMGVRQNGRQTAVASVRRR